MKSVLALLILLILLIIALGITRSAVAERFRTDINPALLDWQGFGEWPSLSEEDSAYLNSNDWRTRPQDERFGRLMAIYDNSFI
ncbi:MAG: hypothetical protein O2960_00145 [Verrucomicrobia bacterium]|nr:hypothetical protein [Verrucomicrobiota bacterium]